MKYILKDYQTAATADVVRALRRATKGFAEDATDYWSVSLSAPTGAGKTVIAAAVIETLFDGAGPFQEDPAARVLWVTDDPALNEQTKRNMEAAGIAPSRLVTIDSGFDRESFEARRVYFLNIQKLSRTNPLSRSNTDNRTYSLWQTISNTIASFGAHFYVIVDEAHRGTKPEKDRKTIVSRIINGHGDVSPPSPIVWGISATPERFLQAIEHWDVERTHKPIAVPLDDVKASGLLKDMIVLHNPGPGQMQGDTTLIRAAVNDVLTFESSWSEYAATQGEPPVSPVLVVQVPNAPTDADMAEYLAAIFETWPGLEDKNVVNALGEHTAISVAGHVISYMAPQNIQDDLDVRVVICKDAISTGWDCPRAEVLVSLRKADDYTYIAQLIGRMVRTPLARRIPTDQTLNNVSCYLPRFNREQVKAIVTRFSEGKSDEPPVELIVDPVRVWKNEKLPEAVFDLAKSLPTYIVPGRLYRTQIARLHTLATLLAGDNVVEDALAQVRIALNGVLIAQRKVLESDGVFQADLERIQLLKIERSFALLAANSMDDLPEGVDYEIERDDNNVEDLFRVATRKLPEGVGKYYWNTLIDEQDPDQYDPVAAKAETAVLALHPEVVEAVESAAEHLVQTWLKKHQPSIAKLQDARKVAYEPVKRETRSPELTDLIVPDTKVVPEARRWPKHILAAEDETYPAALGGWETKVLERELKDKELVAWYRNSTGGNATLRVPWRLGQIEKPMYPDFIFFHDTGNGIQASIVDPHGNHLSDAGPKLRGLADYAEKHSAEFHRIDAVIELDGKILALDLRSESVRQAVKTVVDSDVKSLFSTHGGAYN